MFQLIKPYSRYILTAYVLAVITISSVPYIPTLKIHTATAEIRLDYLIHFCQYGIMAILAWLTFSDSDFQLGGRKFILMASGLILFAVLDEFHQKLIPGRSFNYFDMLSNVLGIISVLIITAVLLKGVRAEGRKGVRA